MNRLTHLLLPLLLWLGVANAQTSGPIPAPTWLDYTSWQSEGQRYAPAFTLPDNRSIALNRVRDDVTPESLIGRGGISAVRSDNIADANRFLWVESKQIGSGTDHSIEYPGLRKSVDEWRAFARRLPLVAVECNEHLEGEWRVPNESDQYRAYEEERNKMYAEAGRTRRAFISYGSFLMPFARDWKINGVYVGPTHSTYRNAYSSQENARAVFRGYFDTGLNRLVYPCNKYYPTSFATAGDFYQQKWQMEVIRRGMSMNADGSGDKLAYVTCHFVESLPGQVTDPNTHVHANFLTARRLQNPAGTVLTSPHPHWDYEQQKAQFFILGMVIGTDVLYWDVPHTYGVNWNTVYRTFPGSTVNVTWLPDQPGTPPPYAPTGEGYPPERLTGYDMLLYAAHLYKQMEVTAGQEWAYTRYKIGSGAWIEPQPDGSDILFHAEAGRGDSMIRRKGNWASLYYYNPNRTIGEYETITFDLGQGKSVTYRLQKGLFYAFNQKLN